MKTIIPESIPTLDLRPRTLQLANCITDYGTVQAFVTGVCTNTGPEGVEFTIKMSGQFKEPTTIEGTLSNAQEKETKLLPTNIEAESETSSATQQINARALLNGVVGTVPDR